MAWNDNLAEGSPAHTIASSDHRRVRVLAGPGTGKSFAMKLRIARLLEEENVQPERILAVTFTRVAADDLHRELTGLGVPGAENLNGRTLHSLAMSILMRQRVSRVLGRRPRPLNDFELEPLLEDLSAKHGNKRERRKLLRAFGAAWARSQKDEPEFATPQERAFSCELVRWLVTHEAMLMDEVIPYLLRYLRANPKCRELSNYDHLLIDEYQDLNRAEQEVLQLLGRQGLICVIGDDNQSIYSFKHAHPEGIRRWDPQQETERHAIEECRRCPTTIVQMANALISKNPNPNRIRRELIGRHENGAGEVVIRQYPTVEAEMGAVSAKITELINNGITPNDIIVLAQRKTLANPIYRRLRDANIQVKSYYAETSLDSCEAQERVALLRLFHNNKDRVALRWLLGFKHGQQHKTQYNHILDYVRKTNDSPWATLCALTGDNLQIPNVRVAELVSRFKEIRCQLQELTEANRISFRNLLESWLPERKETELLASEVKGICDQDNIETVDDLLKKLGDALSRPDVPTEVENVRIMSLHKSKGLSAPCVFIVGCVEGLLPGLLKQPPATQNEYEAKIQEDRRLFYVGITRTKSHLPKNPGFLALTCAQRMPVGEARGNQITPVCVKANMAILKCSRFLREMKIMPAAVRFDQPL